MPSRHRERLPAAGDMLPRRICRSAPDGRLSEGCASVRLRPAACHTPLENALAITLLLLLTTLSLAAQSRRSEGAFRQGATERVVPVFPAASLERKSTGVVVLQVTAETDGRVGEVVVLEAPNAEIGAAARAAALEWRFATSTRTIQSTLTFYFVIENGRGVVRNPEQMHGNEDVFGGGQPGARSQSARPQAPPSAVRQANVAPEIDEGEFTRLLAAANTVVLDVRERDQFAGGAHARARNMPAEEVLTRARAELPVNATVVIDCSRTETFRCYAGAGALRRRGFEQVSIYLP
jgi:TonB family protein